MSKSTLKLCKICFSSDNSINIMETCLYENFFIQILGMKDPPKEMYICVWCKALLKKTVDFIKFVKESHGVLEENTREKPVKSKLLEMSYNHEHLDIPPNTDENNSFINSKAENENDSMIHPIENLYLKEIEFDTDSYEEHETESKQLGTDKKLSYVFDKNIYLYEETKSVPKTNLKSTLMQVKHKEKDLIKEVEDNNNDSKITLTEVEKDGNTDCKNDKMRRQYKELKFEVKYLSEEEMRQEIIDKGEKDRYKSMAFKCTDCAIGFLTNDVFQEHNRRHGEIAGPHKCNTCNLRFKSADVLSQHTLAHKRRFTCVLCGAVFNRWSHCVAHRHKCGMEQANVVCDECHKLFSDNHSLNIHIKGVHMREKKYACTQCEKAFISKQRLTIHIRTHTGQKPFACDECNRKFASNSNLKSHKTVHVNTKTHYCVECNKFYKSEKSLKRHFSESSRHAKGAALSCTGCHKRFTSEKTLNLHINNIHLKHHVYSCRHCNKTFSNAGNLRKHVRCVHEAPNKIK